MGLTEMVGKTRCSVHVLPCPALLVCDWQYKLTTCTRWNSQLTLVRSLLRVSPEVWDKLDTPNKLKQYAIKELCDILQPFEYVTNKIQGQNMVTSSLVVNCVGGLWAALASLHEVYKSKLVSVLQSSTETCLNKFESVEAFPASCHPDPRCWTGKLRSHLNHPCLQEDGDPLGYWKAKQPEFPVLTRLAPKYLAIPATSAPVE
ncbi:putative hAT family C-terminal dimerization region-containing protein 29 [Homarus americanus]|uniref:Putative hAT family C-terminal dimerization region-containing protein 29 n=1 Tax=Homarus americanus TaxID=6706 RepID=A0A8J5J8Z2_HOMAM|nr:putative hAT family C-terminal dimerization region-containing protein 29 [Homarus americanus]